MSIERTLSIIKPDAISKGYREAICSKIEKAGLSILKKKEILLNKQEAMGFYVEHEDKPFFKALIEFMTSGPVQVQVLEDRKSVV